jgi:hypothetical protein
MIKTGYKTGINLKLRIIIQVFGLSAPQRIFTSSAESLSLLRAMPRRNSRGLCAQGRCYSECISTPDKLGKYACHGENRTYDLWNTSPMLCQQHRENHIDSFILPFSKVQI